MHLILKITGFYFKKHADLPAFIQKNNNKVFERNTSRLCTTSSSLCGRSYVQKFWTFVTATRRGTVRLYTNRRIAVSCVHGQQVCFSLNVRFKDHAELVTSKWKNNVCGDLAALRTAVGFRLNGSSRCWMKLAVTSFLHDGNLTTKRHRHWATMFHMDVNIWVDFQRGLAQIHKL